MIGFFPRSLDWPTSPVNLEVSDMRTRAIISCIAMLLVGGCADADRVILVETSGRIPVANATVSILPGIEAAEVTSTVVTDLDGIARFGSGEWRSKNISIKIVKDGVVLFDAIRTGVDGGIIRVRCDVVPESEGSR